MNCEQIHQMLIELVYDELDSTGKAGVQEHIAGCPACREELAKLTQARAALKKFRDGEPEQTAIPAMLAQAGDETAEADSLRRPLKPRTLYFRRVASMFAAAAAAVLIAVAVWMVVVETPTKVMAEGALEIKRQGVSLTIMSAPENVGPSFDQMQTAQMSEGRIAPRYGWQGLTIVRD
ncbi:MAG: zf-HC2 domain-containing protein, partial [Planctomycetaceae bacterium]